MIRIDVGNRMSVLTQEGDVWVTVEEAEARLNETVEDVYERVFGERPMSVEARLALLEKKAALTDWFRKELTIQTNDVYGGSWLEACREYCARYDALDTTQ